jgi:hypothetical protein
VTVKFKVQFLEDAKDFLDNLSDKPREKIIYNIRKAQMTHDKELFKKLSLGLYTTKRITGFLHSGTKQKRLTLLSFLLMDSLKRRTKLL